MFKTFEVIEVLMRHKVYNLEEIYKRDVRQDGIFQFFYMAGFFNLLLFRSQKWNRSLKRKFGVKKPCRFPKPARFNSVA